jgi:hypothetical protein
VSKLKTAFVTHVILFLNQNLYKYYSKNSTYKEITDFIYSAYKTFWRDYREKTVLEI